MAYTRVNWEDRPSTNTPINATNLNKMDKGIKDLENSLATVATSGDYDDLSNKPTDKLVNVSNEVDEDYRVNLLETKNLFDYQNTSQILVGANINVDTNKLVSDSSCMIAYCPCKPNTKYTISRRSPMTNRFVIATSNSKPTIGTDLLQKQAIFDDTTTSYTLTTDANANYIIIRFINNVSSNDYNTYAQTIQVEYGEEATTYEAFVSNQILVDNEKYTDTLNVGSVIDSRSRVNVLKSNNLFDKSKTKYGIAWNNSANANLAICYVACKPNTPYSIKYTGTSGISLTWLEKTSESATSYTKLQALSGATTITTQATSGVITIQFDKSNISESDLANVNIMLVEGNTIEDYEPYITPSIYVDDDEIYSKWKYLGQTTGTTKLQLPNNWKELYIMAKEGSGTTYETAIIMNIGLSAYTQYCIGGRFTSGTNGSGIMANIDADNKIGLNYVYVNSSDVVSNSLMLVYWK